MFATILRRWRIVTPLALALLAVMIVTAGVVNGAAAHNAKYHFWGQAVVLEDNSIVLPAHQCDTGPLESLDGTALNADVGGLVGCLAVYNGLGFGTLTAGSFLVGGPASGDTNNALGLSLRAVTGEATVKSDNTKHEGHVISTATAVLVSLSICIPNALPTGWHLATPSDRDDCDGDSFTAVNPAGQNVEVADTTLTVVFEASKLTTTAEAECELTKNDSESDGRAFSIADNNDLQVLEGNSLVLLTPDSGVNAQHSYPVVNFYTASAGGTSNPYLGPFAEQITTNEIQSIHSGGFSWIKATGLHLIMTDFFGTVLLDLRIDTVFAGIHCGRHLSQDDAIGA